MLLQAYLLFTKGAADVVRQWEQWFTSDRVPVADAGSIAPVAASSCQPGHLPSLLLRMEGGKERSIKHKHRISGGLSFEGLKHARQLTI